MTSWKRETADQCEKRDRGLRETADRGLLRGWRAQPEMTSWKRETADQCEKRDRRLRETADQWEK